jgi:DNA-binding GntR family transcriptional regulator
VNLSRLRPSDLLSEQAYQEIRRFVMSGGLPAEGYASASQIAQELGVSVTPVKEALRRLAEAGLVEIRAQRGVRMVRFDRRDIEEIYQLREGLEALALELAPDPFPPATLAAMEAIVAECDAHIAANDRRRYTEADIRFHELLVEAGGNRRLARALLDLQGQIQLVRLRAIVLPGRPHKSHVEHQQIVAALRTDRARAIEAIRTHVGNVKDDVLNATRTDGTPVVAPVLQ